MIRPEHTQMLVAALGHLSRISNDRREREANEIQLRTLSMQLNARQELAETHAAVFRQFISAMVERRLDVVRDGFAQTIQLYSEQAKSFQEQHSRILDAQINATDPLVRAGYLSRASEIDLQLRQIRTDALKLYRAMTTAVLAIGGNLPPLPQVDRLSLQLPPP